MNVDEGKMVRYLGKIIRVESSRGWREEKQSTNLSYISGPGAL